MESQDRLQLYYLLMPRPLPSSGNVYFCIVIAAVCTVLGTLCLVATFFLRLPNVPEAISRPGWPLCALVFYAGAVYQIFDAKRAIEHWKTF